MSGCKRFAQALPSSSAACVPCTRARIRRVPTFQHLSFFGICSQRWSSCHARQEKELTSTRCSRLPATASAISVTDGPFRKSVKRLRGENWLVCKAGSLSSDGTPPATLQLIEKLLSSIGIVQPPRWLFRTAACLVLSGQVFWRIVQGKVHLKNTVEQLKLVGPKSLGVALLTASFVGMVFTIQFVREFAKLGLTRSVGGVLGLALSRELTPVVTAIILAGRVGSAFAAELGTMQVSEQMDSLRVLHTDPVDYLVTPRVLACMIAGPILNVLCFCMGIAASILLADLVYNVPANVILDSCRRALSSYDVVVSMVKSLVFGIIVSAVSCAWGFTTTGGAKGVGESTTSAVVISLVTIFVADFFLSFAFFQGQGDALKQLK